MLNAHDQFRCPYFSQLKVVYVPKYVPLEKLMTVVFAKHNHKMSDPKKIEPEDRLLVPRLQDIKQP